MGKGEDQEDKVRRGREEGLPRGNTGVSSLRKRRLVKGGANPKEAIDS